MQQNYGKITSAGLGLAAISYDSPAVLKDFAERKGIRFALLSDPGSGIIRRFGILNTQVKENSSSFGIPYPGVYVLDPKGIVTAKYFEDDYKQRDTAAVILMKQFGLHPDQDRVSINAKHVELDASTSDRQASAGQHIALILDVKLQNRVHVYAPGVKNYIPIDWEIVQSAGIETGPAKYPESKILRLQAIHESVPVYQGEFRLVRNLTIGNDQDVKPLLDSQGNLTINGTFRYQACDDQRCFVPETVPVHWTIHVNPLDRARVPFDLRRKEP